MNRLVYVVGCVVAIGILSGCGPDKPTEVPATTTTTAPPVITPPPTVDPLPTWSLPTPTTRPKNTKAPSAASSARSTVATKFANCEALRRTYPGGVSREYQPKAYAANRGLDGDHDGTACEGD